jgi:mitochondrial fission protein ELM1
MNQRALITVWRFSDHITGHDNQSLGLCEALAGILTVERCDLPALSRSDALAALLTGAYHGFKDLPHPQLLVAAGHACHLSLLATRALTAAPAVVLMRPSLPLRLFDLCIAPAHDGLRPGPRVLVSRGALNRIGARFDRDETSGMLLIGGPSKHHDWDEVNILAQIDGLLTNSSLRRWDIADSRRTPESTRRALAARSGPQISFHPVADTASSWLPQRLSQIAQVWVSEDSISMIYEALTAGSWAGLLELPRRGSGRLARGIDELLRSGRLLTYRDWARGLSPRRAPPLAEAARCARYVFDQLLRPQLR